MFLEEKKQGEVKELDAAGKLLLQAADLIEQHGHCKGKRRDYQGAFCVMGAFGYARFGNILTENDDVIHEAHSRLAKALAQEGNEFAAVQWNNARERTAAEVIAKLRAVALSGQC